MTRVQQITKLLKGAKLDGFGLAYKNYLQIAYDEYGIEGLKTQVVYIITNAKFSNKENRKTLVRFSKTGSFKRKTKNETRSI